MKLCIITCYDQPDYIRARTLRSAAALVDGVDVVVVKNSRTGLLRYAEVFVKVLRARLFDKPDAYLLTFRGYEMLLPIRLLSLGKPLIYDEFINPIEWVSYEHKKIGRYNPLTGLLWLYYRVLLAWTSLILTDSDSHADLSAGMMKVRRDKFVTVPVGTDEAVFSVPQAEHAENETFTVFYYGNMLPLHGLDYVIEAAVKLNHEPVKFVIVGGSSKVAHDIAYAVGNGANIDYKAWVEFEKLPGLMQEADICLAGPFGNTFQSSYVITGKAYQYLAMGRPIIVGKNNESGAFTDKTNALVVPQGDGEALAQTIRWALANQAKLAAIGKAGRELYDSEYALPKITEHLEAGLSGRGLTKLGAGTDR